MFDNQIDLNLKYSDVRTSQALEAIFVEADKICSNSVHTVASLLNFESEMLLNPGSKPRTIEHLILKAAISRLHILQIQDPLHLEMIVPVYHEKIRLAPRQGSTVTLGVNTLPVDINGEDSLLRKYKELEWLTRDSKVTFKLRYVDDICDHESGKYVEQLIADNNLSEHVEVHFLGDALSEQKTESLRYKAIETIIKKNESIRGGALCLGFAEALIDADNAGNLDKTIIGYVDADSSYSMTMAGIPLNEMLSNPNIKVMTASRQHELTYIEPAKATSQTSHRTQGLIRLKQIVGFLRKSTLQPTVPADTQSGYKFFRPLVLKETLEAPGKAHNFSYDTQLLDRVARNHPSEEAITTFGVVLVDCDELTTANNGMTYFAALQILLDIAKEVGLEETGYKFWLLKYLTSSKETYKFVISLLEDTTNPALYISEDLEEHKMLLSIRQKIRTNRDTTAVGDYFTEDIGEDLYRVLTWVEKNAVEEGHQSMDTSSTHVPTNNLFLMSTAISGAS